MQPQLLRWSETSSVYSSSLMPTNTSILSGDDVTLLRYLCSSSTNFRPPSGETSTVASSTAAPSLSRPEKNMRVYQMPSYEDDNIILTNLDGKEERVTEKDNFRQSMNS